MATRDAPLFLKPTPIAREKAAGKYGTLVPSYGGPDELSLQQRQQSFLPRQTGWPRSAPPGLYGR